MTKAQQGKRVILFSITERDLLRSRLKIALALRSVGYEVILMSAPGKNADRFKELGIQHVPVNISRTGINPFREMLVFLKIWSKYWKLRPDIVHHFQAKPITYGTVAARLCGVKSIVNTITGLGYVFSSHDRRAALLRPVVSNLYRLAFASKNVSVIFQNSDDAALFLKKGVVTEDRACIVKGSGVDCEVYCPGENGYRDVVSEVKVLFAGRLLRDKGIVDYIRVARSLKAQYPSVKFLVAGDIDPSNSGSISKEEYDRWMREGAVEMLGYRKDLADLLRDVNIVVLPSSYGEGLPRILIEAAASEVPIVAYDIPGCREIIENGVNGLLVPRSNCESLTEAVKILVADSNLRVKLGKAGRKKVLEEFSTPIVMNQVFQIYQKAVYEHV